nr:MAG TPA: hypothetical protein [Caudoviricetes sp.]DAP75866.1 MAG TPA: hypothetical protein [Caudoviricetes sp.]
MFRAIFMLNVHILYTLIISQFEHLFNSKNVPKFCFLSYMDRPVYQ